MEAARQRIDLDWIRGAAALAVAAMHCRELEWVGLRDFAVRRESQGIVDVVLAYLFAPLVWGSAGVAVFFVLSGYVIHAAAARKLLHDRGWQLDVKDFYIRRMVRIYAVLILALLVTFLLDSASRRFAPNHPNLRPLTAASLFGNLFALQGSVFRPYGSNGPLWTLAIEIHFYALYPLLLVLRRSFSAEVLLLASAVLSVASLALFRQLDAEFFTTYYVCWILGFYAAELRAGGRTLFPRAWLPLMAVCAAAAGCAMYFVGPRAAVLAWSTGFFLYLLILFGKPPKEGRIIRALAHVGAFSYTLYAIHEPVVVFLVATLGGGVKTTSMLVVLSFLALTVGVSWLLYRPFERRSIEWLAARELRTRTRRLERGPTGRI